MLKGEAVLSAEGKMRDALGKTAKRWKLGRRNVASTKISNALKGEAMLSAE